MDNYSNYNKDWLDNKQYAALAELFHNFDIAFKALPEYIKEAYYARLYSKNQSN